MSSYSHVTQAAASSSRSTAAPGSSSGAHNSADDDLNLSHMVGNLFDHLMPSSAMPGPSTSTSIATTYDIWSPAPTTIQQPIGTSREYSSMHNTMHTTMHTTINNGHHREENSSGSPSSVSVACFRCEERIPTMRCVECNDLFCHDCCHRFNSECQLRHHTLLPIRDISPIGVRPHSSNENSREFVYCELHGDPLRYYCEACVIYICQECVMWVHKDHAYKPLRGSLDGNRLAILRTIEDTKKGTKAIKQAIDRAVILSKSYEKECIEANLKIRKAMRCYIQAIEDRERFLLEKVERMRQARLSDLSDHMHTLRGILSGLAHTNETLLRSMDLEGVELVVNKEKGRSQVEYFSQMFKQMYMPDERIIFMPPNYDLVDLLKRQCDVQPAACNAMQPINASSITSRQSLMALQGVQYATQSYTTPHQYNIPHSSNNRPAVPDHNNHSRNTGHVENTQPSSNPNPPPAVVEPTVIHGIGQAIPGFWTKVALTANKNGSTIPSLTFGREGGDEGQVSRPWGLCIDREGNIIVADRRNNRVQVFNRHGDFQFMFGSKGTANGEFDLPAGITTDNLGRIIVIDKDNHRVQIFTSGGNFILKFGCFGKENGQFQYPWDVAVNTLGEIIVTDTRNHRIQLFASDGSFLAKFVFEPANPSKLMKGPTTPRGVCFTVTGNIIVSDFENHRLILVDANLSKVLGCVGREGSGFGELNRPSGIVTDDEGRVVVADSKNHRVIVLTPELRILSTVDLKSPGLDDKDRPSDVALTPEGFLVVLFETLPDTARDNSSTGKQYIKVY